MNKLKKATLTVLTLSAIACVATACKEQRTELSAPQNLKLQAEILTWDEVENADQYLVSVDGKDFFTQTNELDVFEITNHSGDFQFQVTALSDDVNCLDSLPSAPLSFSVPKAQFLYGVNADGYAVVKGYSTTKGKLVIPETVDGYEVAEVLSAGFLDCTELTSVILPDTITEIGTSAFEGCSKLERVRLPQDLETLNTSVFSDCDLKKIDVPDSLSAIKSRVFRNNANLKELVLPEDLTELDDALDGCHSLEKIEIPPFVSKITYASGVFSQCDSLTTLTVHEDNSRYESENNCLFLKDETDGNRTLLQGCAGSVIPDGVTKIALHAFYACAALKEISFPDSLTSIDISAFYDCTSLQELYIPDNLTYIDPKAFNGCSGVRRIEVAADNPVYKSDQNCIIRKADNVLTHGFATSIIPDYVKEIGDHAFHRMRLKSLAFPEGLEKIGYYAFAANSFEEISLPASLKVIDGYAFSGCSKLVKVRLSYGITTIESHAFNSCRELRYINIPESITDLSVHAFNFIADKIYVTCPYLSINVPASVFNSPNVKLNGISFYTDSETAARRAAFKYDNEIPYVYSFTFSKGYHFNEYINSLFPVIPAREGYTFVGWALEEGSSEIAVRKSTYKQLTDAQSNTGDVEVALPFDELRPYLTDIRIDDDSKKGTFAQDLTLYAIWLPNE